MRRFIHLGLFLAFFLSASSAYATTITVNTTVDEYNTGSDCSLREAIQAANANAAFGGCPAGQNTPTIDEIILPAGTYTLTITGANENVNASGDLDITQSVTIRGADGSSRETVIVQAGAVAQAGIDRVFHTFFGGPWTITFRGLTIQNGCSGNTNAAPGSACTLGGGGGGIEIQNHGTTNIENCVIRQNRGQAGGGLHPFLTMGSLQTNVSDSLISNNTASVIGGGMSSHNNTTFTRVTVTGNASLSGQNGGGIGVPGGTTRLIDSAIYGNSSGGHGGGVSVQGFNNGSFGTFTATNSTISGNSANVSGGGIYVGGGVVAGPNTGCFPSACSATLNNVTVTNNIADDPMTAIPAGDGGGAASGTASPAGVITVRNSIIAGNTDLTGGVGARPDVSAALTSQNYNLIGNSTGLSWVSGQGSGDLLDMNASLASLADNGGPTQTHALLNQSPAVNAGNPAGCSDGSANLTADQRGLLRPVGSACDMGAYELQVVAVCGNGSVESGEQCDDNNTNNGDGCSSTCQYETGPCDDGSACTTGEAWQSGTCIGGSAVTCNDGNACTNDSCNPASGCVYADNTNSCDDGNACTTGDACSGGSCAGGAPLNCSDGNGCTDDSCNPASGCVHANNTASCDDGNACTATDQCAGGSCGGSGSVCGNGAFNAGCSEQCDDGNTSNGDGCSSTCQYETGPCDDGNACTTGETWQSGTCTGGSTVTCNDNNGCTTDSCNPASGCSYANNTNACDDGNACSSGDACSGGSCAAGAPLVCDDGNGCTDDSCNPATGCVYSNNVASCDDGNACTATDQCSGGTCGGSGSACGNGSLNASCSEQCDDGNATNGDGCNSACQLESCGDGSMNNNGSEQCDDGNTANNDGCSSACQLECGNGALNGAEECDDGNRTNGDCCDSSCAFEAPGNGCNDNNTCSPTDACDGAGVCTGNGSNCGDGTSDAGCNEQCDDGNNANGDGCDAICQAEVCGDGNVNNAGLEACDDGNTANNDGCSAACQLECGDGTVNSGEDCDDGNRIGGDCCDAACEFEVAGNACDDSNSCSPVDACDGAGTCGGSGSTCGNGALDASCGEQCDDANAANGDGCTVSCQSEFCGDGSVNDSGLEACDDGNTANNDGCSSACQLECGNGTVNAGEDCDDGNQANGDCCNAACRFESIGSACNDGNACSAPDACNGSGTCTGSGSTCPDGNVHPNCNEECDDGNSLNGDGCNSVCRVESCGDGSVNNGGSEQCDDGNVQDGDGCTAACQLPVQPQQPNPPPPANPGPADGLDPNSGGTEAETGSANEPSEEGGSDVDPQSTPGGVRGRFTGAGCGLSLIPGNPSSLGALWFAFSALGLIRALRRGR